MSEWTKKQLEELFGADATEQLAFLAGCHKHRLCNDSTIPDGWIVPDEVLKKFAELIVRECCDMVNNHHQWNNPNDCLLVLKIKEHFGVE